MAARGTATTTQLVQNSSVATTGTAGGTANANGHVIPGSAGPLDKMLIRVIATGGAGTAIIRATGNGNNAAGVAQTSPYPSSAVYAQGAVGDLAVTLGSGSTVTIGPLTSDRFTQPDGNIYLDWSTTSTATFDVYVLPYNAI